MKGTVARNSYFAAKARKLPASRFCSRHRPASKPQGPSAPYATRSDIPEPSEPLQPKLPHPPHPAPPTLLTLKTSPLPFRTPHPCRTSSTRGRPARCPGRPGGQPALSGWCTGPSPTRPPPALPLCRPQRLVCGQQAQACSLLRAACLQRPLPRAVLRAADLERVGYRWIGVVEQASGAPWSRSTRPLSTPVPGPRWCLWHPSQQRFSASLLAVPLPFCTGSATSAGLTEALDRPGVVEIGRRCADGAAEAWPERNGGPPASPQPPTPPHRRHRHRATRRNGWPFQRPVGGRRRAGRGLRPRLPTRAEPPQS